MARKDPYPRSAMFALKAASDALSFASDSFSKNDFPAAFESSRNAIRFASSAVMFRDGLISGTLESSVYYLLQRYPGAFPVERWERIESFPMPERAGIYHMLLGALGKAKAPGEFDARDALAVASMFVHSARAELV